MKSVHCIHYVVSKNFAAEPVDDSYHKCPTTGYRRISDVRTPYLIRTLSVLHILATSAIKSICMNCPYGVRKRDMA